MNALLASFHYTHSPTLPKLLWELRCTLVFSTYQAGKVIFIRATSPETIEQRALNFPQTDGIGGLRSADRSGYTGGGSSAYQYSRGRRHLCAGENLL